MPAGSGTPPDDGYFNDLSRQPSHRSNGSESPQDHSGLCDDDGNNSSRPRRIACIICRKRKLKCDGAKPSCSTCSRLRHKCAYDEVRKKSGPKRGYVKELEARLLQVETQLKSKAGARSIGANQTSSNAASVPPLPQPSFQVNDIDMGLTTEEQDILRGFLNVPSNPAAAEVTVADPTATSDASNIAESPTFSWEILGLGLQEPLPPQDMIEDLHRIYFEKVHPSVPMVHKYRYFAAMNLAPHMRPPICLRYAMWATASAVTEKYFSYADVFYQRARKYAEHDEMKGHGETFITVAHSQCWSLIANYEFKMMYFPRAWMSSGRSTRLALMMGLHRLDGEGLEVKQSLASPRDWTDTEERRRTFWAAYCGDRYASIGTGWPMVIDEKDILTNLPSTDEAFNQSIKEETMSLNEALTPDGAASLSSFAGVVLMACLFGRNLTHLHQPDPNDQPEDQDNGEFWKRHRALDSTLTNISLFLPEHLRLPIGARDANIVFLNMNIHTSTICLHQAAILKAEKHKVGVEMIRQSTDRCFMAAGEIVGIMRLVSHIDIGNMNPFMAFCLFVAARIYAHAFKKRPNDQHARSNLEFLLRAMAAGRKKNPLTESFLVQLMVDLEGCGLDIGFDLHSKLVFPNKSMDGIYHESSACPPVLPNHSKTQPSYHELRDANTNAGYNNTYSIPKREQRTPQTQSMHQTHRAYPGQMHGILAQPWEGDVRTRHPTSETLSINSAGRGFDTELSPDQTSERHASLSGQPTPTTSHQASSNTSYSPTGQADPDPTGDVASAARPAGPYFHAPTPSFTGFTPPAHTYATSPDRAMVDPDGFTMPASWDLGPDSGFMPGPEAVLSPMGEAGWSQMLDGMGWDGAGGAGGTAWRPMPMGESRR